MPIFGRQEEGGGEGKVAAGKPWRCSSFCEVDADAYVVVDLEEMKIGLKGLQKQKKKPNR